MWAGLAPPRQRCPTGAFSSPAQYAPGFAVNVMLPEVKVPPALREPVVDLLSQPVQVHVDDVAARVEIVIPRQKSGLFVLLLMFVGINRFVLTERLRDPVRPLARRRLRTFVAVEASLGIPVITVAAFLGSSAPAMH
jgi:hypothetical protein